MEEKEKNKQVIKITTFITSVFVIILSISYAFLNQTLTGTKRQLIVAGNLQLELKEGDSITLENALPMYDEVGMIGKPFEFILHNKTTENTKYTIKLKDVTEGTNKLETSTVKYGLTKEGIVVKDLLSNLTDNIIDTGVISGNQTIYYSLRLWMDSNVEDETQIKGKTLQYKIEVEAVLDKSIVEIKEPVSQKAFLAENLGENCKTYDDGIDTFLVGQCQNNYVWYSGKLWRIVLKNNETGAIKMVTDNAITSISANSSNNKNFENSYLDQWLTQEFLPTLHDYQDYLVVDDVWDTTIIDALKDPSRPTNTAIINRTVGLLNDYEHYEVCNNSSGIATFQNCYLNNGEKWWLINADKGIGAWNIITEEGEINDLNIIDGYGVRPAVNLKSTVKIDEGFGTLEAPYKLVGDQQNAINGITTLSTRYSGEYIKFNNELYRIIGTEQKEETVITKITSVSTPLKLIKKPFHQTNGVTDFASASIKSELERYYEELPSDVKILIEQNTSWYLGTVGKGVNYKASICATVNSSTNTKDCNKTSAMIKANIGLSRIGEIFSSPIIRGTRNEFWLLTPYDSSYVYDMSIVGSLSQHVTSYQESGARPSMYLKSNVVIAKDNTGDGTYEHPYDIELGE